MNNNNNIDAGDGTYLMVDGQIVERDALHIAEKIHEYDDRLELYCIDPDKAGITDKPFVVVETYPDGRRMIAFEAWTLDERLMERIYMADQHKFDSLSTVDGMLAKQRAASASRYKEVQEERKEIMLAAVVNPKSSFSLINKQGDHIKINDETPVTVNKGKKSIVMPNKRYTPSTASKSSVG